MSEQPTTPGLVELTRRLLDALNSGDFDAVMSFYAPDAVLDSMGMGTSFEGVAAIRGFARIEWFTERGEALEAVGLSG